MRSLAAEKQVEHPELIVNRYRVEGSLGRGGMAVVYKVHDSSTDRHLALKQLIARDEGESQKRNLKLFEREFQTLCHLAHPRVVGVYDYGLDDHGPFYTMELLDGGDLRALSPMDWKEACRLMLDVCSVLSLLHSRRLVHRDLSHRNVRCTSDGLAKVIDFGAMVPVGPCRHAVGTPAFVAPEVLNLQSLDGRADLYSLGATLYYTLTGRQAYPARNFEQVRERWRMKPPAPSELVPGIPQALDRLVISLLSIDLAARPANAAEVMERLSAIADLNIDEQLVVSHAYLSAPDLVGREWALMRLRKKLRRARRGRGNTLIVRGASGVGRSRFIDACVLRGKLTGATVVRADAADARAGDWGVVRALAKQLLQAAPEEAFEAAKPRVGILGHILPELLDAYEGASLQSFDRGVDLRARLQVELREWFFQVSRQRYLLVAVDDIHRIDEPSAAFIAFLSHAAAEHPLVVCVSAETNAPTSCEGALKLLSDVGTKLGLKNLNVEQIEQLLGSVFGRVPNLQLVAHRIHAISQGNPRDAMQLAQHLVDRKVVTYQAGAWSLPDHIDTGDLPSNMAQALSARVGSLSAEARLLAQTMALSPEQSFSFEDCLVLAEHDATSGLMQSLDELVTAEVLKADEERYAFKQKGWISALRSDGDEERERAAHLRLAEMFERRQEEFRVAQHLLRAGEKERGLDVLIDYAERSKTLTDRDSGAYFKLLQSMPSDWYETYLDAIAFGKKSNRSRIQIYSMQSRLVGFGEVMGTGDTTNVSDLLHQFYHDSGLGFYHQLDDSMDPSERLKRALELAQERYEKNPPEQRVLDPSLSIRQLARTMLNATGLIVSSCDVSFWETLPSMQPLIPLSPALGVIDKIVRGLGNRITSRCELACQEYREILERIAQPDRAGLDETYHKTARFAVLRGIGMLEAAMGLDSALGFASEMEKEPVYEINALQIRMLYYLWQGDSEQAEHYKKRIELLQIQKSPIQLSEGYYLLRELIAYALSDDLTAVRRSIKNIEKMAERYPAWVPTLHYARGEYQRIRGDYQSALSEFQQELKLTAPGRHQSWADTAGAYLRTLLELERYEETSERGERYLQAAEQAELGYMCNYLRMPLAVAEARLGRHQNAVKYAQAAVDHFETIGATGINLGLAYEARSRVAIAMKDLRSYEKYASLCAEQFRAKENPALIAKWEKTEQEAHHPARGLFANMYLAAGTYDKSEQHYSQMVFEALKECDDPQERAQRMLEMLIEHSQTSQGFLYTMQRSGPALYAQVGSSHQSVEIDAMVNKYITAELDGTVDATATNMVGDYYNRTTSEWTGQNGEEYRPVLLAHYTEKGYAVTGLAVLQIDPNKTFIYPAEIVIALSKFAFDSGDVTTCFATCLSE